MHIIYIPGFGDDKSIRLQKLLMIFWPKFGARVSMFTPNWHSDESADDKYQRLLEFVYDIHTATPRELIIIGVSAGGPLAVRYSYAHLPKKIYLVSAKLHNSSAIGKRYQRSAPAIVDTVRACEYLIETHPEVISNITTVVWPLRDDVVPLKDMHVTDAKSVRMPAFNHPIGIALALLFYLSFSLRK